MYKAYMINLSDSINPSAKAAANLKTTSIILMYAKTFIHS